MMENDVRPEIDKVISELESLGISNTSHMMSQDVQGLGDLVESVLTKVGITEERFKEWFNLKECGCSKRKAWLNSLFSWTKNRPQA
jgi:hypothetical protein